MDWLFFALLAYLINAVAFVIDKYLLSAPLPRPFAYAFWVAALSVFALVLIPFGVSTDFGPDYFLISLGSGLSFFIGLNFLYFAIKATDVSIASTMSGVLTAVFSYFLSVSLLGEAAGILDPITLILLLVGTIFLGDADRNSWKPAIASGLFFGLSFVLLDMSFIGSDFVNGLFWTRMGFVSSALLFLAFPAVRRDVFASARTTRTRTGVIFVVNKILAALGFVTLYYAINLGNVATVNSLLGLQFFFIFIIAVLLRKRIPGINEHLARGKLAQKLAGIAFIAIGFLKVLFR